MEIWYDMGIRGREPPQNKNFIDCNRSSEVQYDKTKMKKVGFREEGRGYTLMAGGG